jgi:molybdopterin synthase sulfur carrier subunit
MAIEVRYFASLRERMGRDQDRLEADGVRTVADVWARAAAGEALPEHILCAVNMEYAPPSAMVHDGDEVAFFPPVTGG